MRSVVVVVGAFAFAYETCDEKVQIRSGWGCTLSFSAFYHLQNHDEVGEVGNFLCAYLLFSSILRLLIFHFILFI